ncbi:MAG: RdgB/HAM1 family non-canonical purine NTP pyrophosphatase [Desulfovibrio sp.]|jgi:XTP/dITP diphosphohydrolase|nr:RdgB/HAM1 family non-canonical purine NTP pyrophosphatase [Desulfovibrio sp.]
MVLATGNAEKVAELSAMLAGRGLEVLGLAAFPGIGDIEEIGLTFEDNAFIKARRVAAETGLVSLADDSGLAVDALDGAPGVRSARYADELSLLPGESRDARNIRKLLTVMAGVLEEKRTCRFVCCMAAVFPDGREMLVRGEWRGRLLSVASGLGGFGYDPVFFDPAIGKSAAELSREEKNAVSHRGGALRTLLADLAKFIDSRRCPAFRHSARNRNCE